MSTGGILLIDLRAEVDMLNDSSYQNNPSHVDDLRWVHRVVYPTTRYAVRNDPTTTTLGRVIQLHNSTLRLVSGHAEGVFIQEISIFRDIRG
jgi:hypothetical protein